MGDAAVGGASDERMADVPAPQHAERATGHQRGDHHAVLAPLTGLFHLVSPAIGIGVALQQDERGAEPGLGGKTADPFELVDHLLLWVATRESGGGELDVAPAARLHCMADGRQFIPTRIGSGYGSSVERSVAQRS